MNLIEQLNGTILRGLAIFGAVAIALVVLLIIEWFAMQFLGLSLSGVWQSLIGLVTLAITGGGAAKYVSAHIVSKKE